MKKLSQRQPQWAHKQPRHLFSHSNGSVFVEPFAYYYSCDTSNAVVFFYSLLCFGVFCFFIFSFVSILLLVLFDARMCSISVCFHLIPAVLWHLPKRMDMFGARFYKYHTTEFNDLAIEANEAKIEIERANGTHISREIGIHVSWHVCVSRSRFGTDDNNKNAVNERTMNIIIN